MEHGTADRATHDVDCFTHRDGAVKAAAAAVAAALESAGLHVAEVTAEDNLGDLFYGMGDDLAEWIITSPVGERVILQIVHLPRTRRPVQMAIGAVLHPQDLIGSKTAAAITRAEPRDWVDLWRVMECHGYTVTDLIWLACQVDGEFADEELATAGAVLDETPDSEFATFGLSRRDITSLRRQFRQWPR